MIISDVVETVTFKTETWLKLRDRDFIKNPETETQDFKICAFRPIWNKMSSLLLSWIFLQISGIFPTGFGCFLPANTTNKSC